MTTEIPKSKFICNYDHKNRILDKDNILFVDKETLYHNLSAAVIIALGLISAEANADNNAWGIKRNQIYNAMSILFLLVGFGLFILNKHESIYTIIVAILIPVWAVGAQTVFNRHIEDSSIEYRRNFGKRDLLFAWGPFIMLWMLYLYLKDTASNRMLNMTGMMFLGGGMMIYFFTRRYSWRWLMGGKTE